MGSRCETYVLFRHVRRPNLWCAIPEECPFPLVLDCEAWDRADLVATQDSRPPGFDEGAASFSCGLQGFYIFHWGGRTVLRPRSRVLEQAAA